MTFPSLHILTIDSHKNKGQRPSTDPKKLRILAWIHELEKTILDTITTMMWWLYMYLSVIIFLDSNNNSSVHKGCRSWSGTRHHGQVIFHSKHRHWKLKLKNPKGWWKTPKVDEKPQRLLKKPKGWWFFPRFIAISVEGFIRFLDFSPGSFHPHPPFFKVRSKERHVPNPWACGSIWCNRVFARQSCSGGRETHGGRCWLQGTRRRGPRCFCCKNKRAGGGWIWT